jgi:hypothetical protein
MGPGHFGVGLAAKPLAPKAPLWVLLVASEALDLLCAGFVALGVEKIAASTTDLERGVQIITPGWIPWSHGLFMSLIWAVVFGAIAFLLLRDRRAGVMLGLVVFSHWVLDLIVHLPDLPVFLAGSPMLGLGLWGSGPGLILSGVLEVILLGGGFTLYLLWRRRH